MEKVGRPTALTKEEEIIVKEHVKALADSGILVGQDDVSLVIQRYLNSTNRKVKVFTNNRPGWEWSQLFLGRHQDLKLAFGHNISRGRAQVDEAKIKQFFDNLEVELQDVSPENIYNFDETGFHDDPKKKKMIFKRKCRNPEVIHGCTAQNRNNGVSNALLHLAMARNVVITQKYLEKGHTKMEVDSVHSVIERKLKNRNIFTLTIRHNNKGGQKSTKSL
ncbi:unnamed protein product [Arctia plantaginis]|uniref:Uncharacterized protein n=1 Tax=Arctia plantaginis TaxID=874455 RepID=A0A8S1B334_ARCPL|nr:unnamed protein product [Arctia plantaginis]